LKHGVGEFAVFKVKESLFDGFASEFRECDSRRVARVGTVVGTLSQP